MTTLNEDIERNKELMKIIHLSDLKTEKGGSNWDPRRAVRNLKNIGIYTLENGLMVKREVEPSRRNSWNWSPKTKPVFYLTPEEAEETNNLLSQVKELESQAKELRKRAKEIYLKGESNI
jgi:hypothetical protein